MKKWRLWTAAMLTAGMMLSSLPAMAQETAVTEAASEEQETAVTEAASEEQDIAGTEAVPESEEASEAGTVEVSKTDGVTETKYGKVRGFLDDSTYTFRGIPYAKAERFQMPQEPDSWEGTKDCLVYGPTAPITDMTEPDGGDFLIPHRYWAQNEDCQNLNIWTQSLDPSAKKPVMVWFHGGGYTNGSAIEGMAYDGKNLSEYGDVVVVTVNHRLNVLGYLDLSAYGEEYKYSGNSGTADLVASLQWIRENIENFGGDPDNVTIFGQSGGGGKVMSMMSVPAAEGLFSQAVIESGSDSFRDQETAQRVAEVTLENLGLTADQADQLADVPYDELNAAANDAVTQVAEETGGSASWAPVIDGEYFPADPMEEGFQDWAKDIPVMVGSVFAEMNGFGVINPDETSKNDWTEEEVSEKLTEKYGEKAQDVLEAFQAAYPEKKDADAYYVESRFRGVATRVAQKRNEEDAADCFVYLLSYESPIDGGVVTWHCAEIPLVFHNLSIPAVGASYGESETAYELQEILSSAWVNFAYSGDPNGDQVPSWTAYTADNEATMVFDTESGERVSFDNDLQALIQ